MSVHLSTLTLSMIDGVNVVVPESINCITRYVLEEQRDWFECEIKFVRHLLKEGDYVIDIGANLGVYSLAMAKKVGSTGQVWSFEPTFEIANLLSRSIKINNFDQQIVLDRHAISDYIGKGELNIFNNSEMNKLKDASSNNSITNKLKSERVNVTTLDQCMKTHGWQPNISFMKIDVEGQELHVIKGGERFFEVMSPLVQYEVKSDNKGINCNLIDAFAKIGYHSYRLVPGLNVLVPFENTDDFNFALNLFCCKQDRAEQLYASNYLLTQKALNNFHTPCFSLSSLSSSTYSSASSSSKHNCRDAFVGSPHGLMLSNQWDERMKTNNCDMIQEILSLYNASHYHANTMLQRFSALQTAFHLLITLCSKDNNSNNTVPRG